MAWFRRRRPASTAPTAREDFAHLDQFVRSRRGVEGYLEPKTTVTEATLLLVAHDGEWTRRRVPGFAAARSWAARVGIPVYEVNIVGYPQRMRDYNERRKRAQAQAQRAATETEPKHTDPA